MRKAPWLRKDWNMRLKWTVLGLAFALSASLANADWHRLSVGGLKTEVIRDGDTFYSIVLDPATWPFTTPFTTRNLSTSTDRAVNRVKLIPPSEHVQLWLAMVLSASAQDKAILVEGWIENGSTLRGIRLAVE